MDDTEFRTRIVAIARRWIGTPYHHQACREGVGCDCLGLLRGIWRELVGGEPGEIPAYTQDWLDLSEDDLLLGAAHQVLAPVSAEQMATGDVIVFKMKRDAQSKHLGILVDPLGANASFVHSYSNHGVVETRLSGSWLRRSSGIFQIPNRSA